MTTWIGIDPGVHTGFAVWQGGRFSELETFPLHRAFLRLLTIVDHVGPETVRVVFEDARQRKWIPREASISEAKGRAQGAGSVKRDCAIWEAVCKDYGISFDAVPPRQGLTKLTPEAFARLTGVTERTSNHARDAAMLVFGR